MDATASILLVEDMRLLSEALRGTLQERGYTVTIASDDFRFAAPYVGMEVIARAGTVIGHDGARAVATPYDNCVLIMPSMRLRKGETAVRLGRIVGG